jgi:hypothetical protein
VSWPLVILGAACIALAVIAIAGAVWAFFPKDHR